MALLHTAPTASGPSTPLTWTEHLVELRHRLLISIIALAVATMLAWFAYDHVLAFMITPYRHYLTRHSAANISHGDLVTTAPLEGFTTRLKVSGYLGGALAAPVWIWQSWRFVAPGLYRNEKRYAGAFVAAAVTLFAVGVATAVLVFPKAITWMISVSGAGVAPLFSPSRYLGLYAVACVIFGAVFTYPVFLVALELLGVLPTAKLRHWRRYAVVICCAAAAVITPSSDPFSFLAMAVPMIVFYEASILIGRALHK
ncbi:MAG: twin-arginine translocase subunit TatC [Acidimicrobiales bacterium]|nr:twin-arginine translocase subunit TatC [Acidimicrobiales bacterium]